LFVSDSPYQYTQLYEYHPKVSGSSENTLYRIGAFNFVPREQWGLAFEFRSR